MIRRTLPGQGATATAAANGPVIYAHTENKYHYPEHQTPYTLVANHLNTGNYLLNRKQMQVKDGSYYLLNAGDTLEIDFKKQEPLQTLLIQFDTGYIVSLAASVNASYEDGLKSPEELPDNTVHIPSVPFKIEPALRQKLSQLVHTLPDDTVTELLNTIAGDILHAGYHAKREIRRLTAVKRSTREELFRRLSAAKAFIDEHFAEPLNAESIAIEACMNSFHFLRLFRELYGLTPHQYLTKRRLAAACLCLQSGNYSVSETCAIAGFSSVSSFSLLFKSVYMVSPLKYRLPINNRLICK